MLLLVNEVYFKFVIYFIIKYLQLDCCRAVLIQLESLPFKLRKENLCASVSVSSSPSPVYSFLLQRRMGSSGLSATEACDNSCAGCMFL